MACRFSANAFRNMSYCLSTTTMSQPSSSSIFSSPRPQQVFNANNALSSATSLPSFFFSTSSSSSSLPRFTTNSTDSAPSFTSNHPNSSSFAVASEVSSLMGKERRMDGWEGGWVALEICRLPNKPTSIPFRSCRKSAV